MTMPEPLAALRRANPRAKEDFDQAIDAAAEAVAILIGAEPAPPRRAHPRPHPSRRTVGVSAAALAVVGAAIVAALLTFASPGSGPGVENAAAAVRKAVRTTAASADRSGTAVVRITHNGDDWAGTTIRWNGADLAVTSDSPRRPGGARAVLLVVGGTLYGIDPAVPGGWLELGDPASIDPDSGTTPSEYLAAVREDVGGVTLRRITANMTDLHERRLPDGSTVYSGTIAAGQIAREEGYKEGRHIRVFPFGFVAHDEAADPSAPLTAEITVDGSGLISRLSLSWGKAGSAWHYEVAYKALGSTPAPTAPENARDLRQQRSP